MPGVSFFPLSDVPFLSLFFNFYGYYLPFFLYAVWTPLAIYDLSATSYRSSTSKVVWTLIVLLIPLLGSMIYHIFVADKLDVTVRATMIFGGLFVLISVFLYLALAL